MSYRGVIFDLDGTLLDTIDDLADAMNAALAANGLPTHPDVERHKHFVGDGVRAYILRVLPEDLRGDEDVIARLTATYRTEYSSCWANRTRPYEGVADLLDALARREIGMAVLSNKPDGFTHETVAEFLGLERFSVVRGAIEGVPLKPDPTSAVAVAAEMSLPVGEIAYVGDTATDMTTAGAAGMFAIGAVWGFRSAGELRDSGAQALVGALYEILEHL